MRAEKLAKMAGSRPMQRQKAKPRSSLGSVLKARLEVHAGGGRQLAAGPSIYYEWSERKWRCPRKGRCAQEENNLDPKRLPGSSSEM